MNWKRHLVLVMSVLMAALFLASCTSTTTQQTAETTDDQTAQTQTEATAEETGPGGISESVEDYDYDFGPLMTAAIESGEFGPIMTRMLEDGVLRVGLNATDPPWQFHKIVDGEDQIFGFDKAICDWIGAEVGRIFGVDITVEFEDTT